MADKETKKTSKTTPKEKGGLDIGGMAKRKVFGLPGWAVIGLAVGGLLILLNTKRNATGGSSTAAENPNPNNTAPPVIVITNPGQPGQTGPTGSTGSTGPKGPPGKPGSSGGGHKPRKYEWVTVSRWSPNHHPWNSTLSGIAQHYHVAGGYKELAKLNHISNPNVIQPGQRIKVPVNRK